MANVSKVFSNDIPSSFLVPDLASLIGSLANEGPLIILIRLARTCRCLAGALQPEAAYDEFPNLLQLFQDWKVVHNTHYKTNIINDRAGRSVVFCDRNDEFFPVLSTSLVSRGLSA